MLKRCINKDLVSVVVPAYNQEKYIDECIDSIINQTYNNIELIILNDGSNDKTSERIKLKYKECEARFKRFLFLDNVHKGVIRTLNDGCFQARGEYISLCASDDKYVPSAIEDMHRFLKRNYEYVLCVGDNALIDEKGQRFFFNEREEITYDINKASYLSFSNFLKINRNDIYFESDKFGTYESLVRGNYIPNGYLFRTNILVNKVNGFPRKKF